jgi:hypothetical protein
MIIILNINYMSYLEKEPIDNLKKSISIIENKLNKIENYIENNKKIKIVFNLFVIYIIIYFYNYKYQKSLIVYAVEDLKFIIFYKSIWIIQT